MEPNHTELDRADTGIRILYSVLFVIINNLLTGAIGIIVVFELGFSLITKRPPPTRVRRVANSVISYSYRLQRWLTHTEARLPFPFSDLPEDIHAIEWPYSAEPNLGDPELERVARQP